jgi:uncharacterized protein YdaU (DUF1376 family)
MNPAPALYWMRLEIDRFSRAMAHLSEKEFTVLMKLIWHCWATGQNDFTDLNRVARVANVDARELQNMIPVLVSTGLLEYVEQMRKEQIAKMSVSPAAILPFGVKK